MQNSTAEIKQRIESYIRLFYRRMALQGFIKFLIIAVLSFLGIVVLEYFGRFGTSMRAVLFGAFITGNLFFLVFWVAVPLLRMMGIAPRMSHEEAAKQIGNHFSDIEDKLLNTIQLGNLNGSSILQASVNQRVSELSGFDFSLAVSKDLIKKYIFRFVPVIVLLLIISWIKPSILTDGTNRVVKFQQEFIPPAPFEFIWENKLRSVEKGSNISIQLKMEGEVIPSQVKLLVNGRSLIMQKKKWGNFFYELKNIQEAKELVFSANGYSSITHKVDVYPSPKIEQLRLQLDYPAYTGKKPEVFNQAKDLLIPEGTSVTWTLKGDNCDQVFIALDTTDYIAEKNGDDFVFEKVIKRNYQYSIHTRNQFIKQREILQHQIVTIKDEFPRIRIQKDSLTDIFYGVISDDYGFHQLKLMIEKEGKLIHDSNLEVKNNQVSQSFVHELMLDTFKINQGEELNYYFEVWDNDAINGSKSTKSQAYVYRKRSKKELKEEGNKTAQSIKNNASSAMKELKELQKSIEEFQQNMLEKKSLSWEDKRDLQDLLKQQRDLEDTFKQMSELQKDQKEIQKELSPEEEALLKKQEELERLFDELMDEETKKMMEELEKLMEEMNKDKIQDLMKNMEISNEDMEKELDRSLELFKQLEFDIQLAQTINELEELAKKQKELANKTEKSNKDELENLKSEQEQINKEFDALEKQMDDLKKKNEELENARSFDEQKEQRDQIKEQQDKASEQLEKNKSNKASDNQKSAGEKMEEMAEQMQAMMQQSMMQQQQEDMEDLRGLLDNLLVLSLQQENLKKELMKIHRNDPNYPKVSKAQASIRDETTLIQDSLFALSKRVVQLESVINKELGQVNRDLEKALKFLTENNIREAGIRQQLVMTGYNNLALLMDDVLQQMQQQMQSAMKSQSCNKPGNNNKPSMSGSQMQQQLNQQMKKMLEEMGKNPGGEEGKEQGKGKNGQGDQGMNQQIARMAAEQAAIRQELEKLKKQLEKEKNSRNQLDNLNNAIKGMEEVEKQLYNKNLSTDLLRRQQEILTRLLESDKAWKEREFDNKRESNIGKNKENGNPENLMEYKRLKELERELLKTVPPNMKPYYKRKAMEYINMEK